ncbi:MAG: hypothetical protein AB1454_07000 [Candidatus Auribacterota bacterium]|jgi:hypothetical protein|uniref:Uncharacterized protein n=1 Tax=Candidatus Auribacter fodinae TaxID=2093366 RepID=A0A3A4QXT7_9BACT|nr:MAG: hypothetical protein C4541_07725 [Candidatus Auribacter fodinae]
MKTVLIVLIDNRSETAVNVQKVLTAWGCIIKTRLGIHDGVLDKCSQHGLLVLELVGEPSQQEEFERKLDLIKGVSTQLVRLHPDE